VSPGDPVQVKFPSGWKSGFVFIQFVAAVDREYRIHVMSAGGANMIGVAGECVRLDK